MVKDKNSYGIQLQNQKLDIKRLISLQSIHAARSIAETSTSKAQLTLQDERARISLSIPGETVAAVNVPAAPNNRGQAHWSSQLVCEPCVEVLVPAPAAGAQSLAPAQAPFIDAPQALSSFFLLQPDGLNTIVWLDLFSTSQHATFDRPPLWCTGWCLHAAHAFTR